MKIPASGETSPNNSCYWFEQHMKYGDLLFDLETDPGQQNPLKDPETEERMKAAMKELMKENEAPSELYERIEL